MNSSDKVQLEINKTRYSIAALSMYRNIASDPVIHSLNKLLDCFFEDDFDLLHTIKLYNEFFYELMNRNHNFSIKEYLIEKIIFDENLFTLSSEKSGSERINESIIKIISNDLVSLQHISSLSPLHIKNDLLNRYSLSDFEKQVVESLPEWNTGVLDSCESIAHYPHVLSAMYLLTCSNDWSGCTDGLADFYNKFGSGIFSRYKAFIWEHRNDATNLRGVENPDPVALQELIGYDAERSQVINNTLQFLKGFPANNILLYGDRGTGKSSTVKAILNEYHTQGLRLVEIPKKHLMDFPEVIRILSGRKQKFIIFIDDLAFEDNEESYTGLKAVLEGGIESRPENVVIYATSNRRHLIKERFSDRSGLYSSNTDDEIRSSDTIQEKLSLSDRFGITVVFSSPDKYKFLEIVDGLILQREIKADKEFVHREALKWELWYNGRSPRTARQFVDWLEGELAAR
ncbi:MAG: ATP-binding protein [Clostridia bacterium]|nr:ATP-binding protein [Clostridia bacterium]